MKLCVVRFFVVSVTTACLIMAPLSYAGNPGEVFPDGLNVMHFSGKAVRKGVVAATIKNILALDQQNEKEKKLEYAHGISDRIQDLDALGVFDMFPISYWIGAPKQGARLLGLLYAHSKGVRLEPFMIDKNDLELLTLTVLGHGSESDAIKPEGILADGEDFAEFDYKGKLIKARKGTIKSFFTCIEALQTHSSTDEEYKKAIATISELKLSLLAVDFFTVFSLDLVRLRQSPYLSAFTVAKEILKQNEVQGSNLI